MSNAVLLLISGPAGSGKTTLCERLHAACPDLERVVTATTRAPRDGEKDGRDYFFLTNKEFEERLAQGDFYEHARVHGRLYGVLKEEIDHRLDAGVDLLLNVDVQGAASFRQAAQENPRLAKRLVTVFIEPQSIAQLKERLSGRGENEEEIERRLQSAQAELPQTVHFDHRIVSTTKEADFAALEAIYRQAKG